MRYSLLAVLIYHNFFNFLDYKESETFCRICMEKIYCHALAHSGLRNRAFLGKMLEEGRTWKEIYKMVKSREAETLASRIHWRNIYPILDQLDVEKAYKLLLAKKVKFLIGEEIPESLREIPDPPLFLYLLGNTGLLYEKKAIGLVGARDIMPHSQDVLETIVPYLVNRGLTVVSGLAQGVDIYAHRMTMKYGGKAFAVLGNGVTECCPHMNIKWYREILKNDGCILSEYPPGCPADHYTFPERNRIIAGLSQALLVVQASLDSGSLITASHALDQGKNVYVVPGLFGDERFSGSNRLIRDGAYIIPDLDTLQSFLGGKVTASIPFFSNDEEKKVWELLIDSITVDELIEKTSLDIAFLTRMLLSWELEGKVKQEGGRYRRS